MKKQQAKHEKFRKEHYISDLAAQVRSYRPDSENYHHPGFQYAMTQLLDKVVHSAEPWQLYALYVWADRPVSLDGMLEQGKEGVLKASDDDIKETLMLYIGRVSSPISPRRSFNKYLDKLRRHAENGKKPEEELTRLC